MENKLKISISSLSELSRVADAVIERLNGRNVVAFRAPMGAGKTTLIAEIVAALGSGDVVTSPTFALVNEYDTDEGGVVYHFDFYRIKSLEEVYNMGYEEYLYSDAVCFMEWPELIEGLLPEECIRVEIEEENDGTRTIAIIRK